MKRQLQKSWLWTIVYLASFLFATAIIAAALPYAFDWIARRFFPGASAPNTGEVFTGVGALFSAIAFAGILITIVLQSRELALQRAELEDTRTVLGRQADALELQQFENTFFQMLRLHHDIVRGMVEVRRRGPALSLGADPTPDRHWEGRAVLRLVLADLKDATKSFDKSHSQMTIEWRAKHSYEKTYEAYGHFLGHYFRNMYHIIKLVDSARIEDKRRYSSLLRAQLSGVELELLFFNCISEQGEGFKENVEKYALLEHVPLQDVLTQFHLPLYGEAAYGDRKSLLVLRQSVISEGPNSPP